MRSRRQIALTVGVSLIALGFPVSAYADTVAGISDTNEGPSVSDTLTISSIGDPNATFGVTDVGSPTASANVYLPDFGGIMQTGGATGTTANSGSVTLVAKNGGSVSVRAQASATASASSALAQARIGPAFFQSGVGSGKISLTLKNSGSLDASAKSHAAGQSATARANLGNGVIQFARGGVAKESISNTATMAFTANAAATATSGPALATARANGVAQWAFGHKTASVSLANAGSYSVDALAKTVSPGSADAIAQISDGLSQLAAAHSGPSSASLRNDGLITIDASALATGGNLATADAWVKRGIGEAALSHDRSTVSLINEGTIAIEANAQAVAANATGSALVNTLVGGLGQAAQAVARSSSSFVGSNSAFYSQIIHPAGLASVSFQNDGKLDVRATARATAANALASASASAATQYALGAPANVSLLNNGTINIDVSASWNGSEVGNAHAGARGIHQSALSTGTAFFASQSAAGNVHTHEFHGAMGPASASLVNNGTISFLVQAQDHSTNTARDTGQPFSLAGASAIVAAASQTAVGTQAKATFDNIGNFVVKASAAASGFDLSNVQALAVGLNQAADAVASSTTREYDASGQFISGESHTLLVGPASAIFDNSGVFSVEATANGQGNRVVDKGNVKGVNQFTRGSQANAIIDNSGSLEFAINGTAEAQAFGSQKLYTFGIQQEAGQTAILLASPESAIMAKALANVTNSGSISVSTKDRVTATGSAIDVAVAADVNQIVASFGSASADVTNSGTIKAVADGGAQANSYALAVADAAAIIQAPHSGELHSNVVNSGNIDVTSLVNANAADGTAIGSGHATDVLVVAKQVDAKFTNSGSLSAMANVKTAGKDGSALAFAAGVSMIGESGYGANIVGGGISGKLDNSGLIQVAANLDAGKGQVDRATATGIFLQSDINTLTVTNSGAILVDAVAKGGGSAKAYGVHTVNLDSAMVPGPTDTFTFTNDGGTLIVRQSIDGGATWRHGMAIDLTTAPNRNVINLVGNGLIYGNIAVQAADEISVKNGRTYFDGAINAALFPNGAPTNADLDSGLSGVGSLTIEDGGNLVLANSRITGQANMYDGPSYALTNSLNIASDGTLTLQLQPAGGGLQTADTYPQIFTNVANLSGKLVADVTPTNGLFADSYDWQNVIDANVRNGKFDDCLLGGSYAGSLLLNLTCSYDSGANVDLLLTRVTFNAVAGLNANASSVGSGLEAIYSTSISGGAQRPLSDLFRITKAASYNIALNQLSGSSYANYLNSFPSLGVHLDDLFDRAPNCDNRAVRSSVLECRASSRIQFWGQLDDQSRKANGDLEAGTSTSNRSTELIGLDTSLGEAVIVGAGAGHVKSTLRDKQFGDEMKGDGWQAGAYAVYDPGPYYLKGVTSFTSLSGNATRHISFSGLGSGTSFGSTPQGKPDVQMWTAGLRGGVRIPLNGRLETTPYVSLDYVHAKLGGFDETNDGGAGLAVSGGMTSSAFATGGVKLAAKLGSILPELNFGYRYRFGDSNSAFSAKFNSGSSGADGNFDIVSATQKRGTLLAGVSLGGKIGRVQIKASYEGEFNGGISSHGGSVKLILPLGGHAPAAD